MAVVPAFVTYDLGALVCPKDERVERNDESNPSFINAFKSSLSWHLSCFCQTSWTLFTCSKLNILLHVSHNLCHTFTHKESESEVTQSCLTFPDPMDCSPPGSSIHGIFQARVLEWVAISFFRGSSRPKDRTRVSHVVDRCFTTLQRLQLEGLSQFHLGLISPSSLSLLIWTPSCFSSFTHPHPTFQQGPTPISANGEPSVDPSNLCWFTMLSSQSTFSWHLTVEQLWFSVVLWGLLSSQLYFNLL